MSKNLPTPKASQAVSKLSPLQLYLQEISKYSLLTPEEVAQFSDQAGLNGNRFWQRSYRGKPVGSPEMFWRTISYVHWNPVKAGYVELPGEYGWSSAKMWEDGLWDEDTGLRI